MKFIAHVMALLMVMLPATGRAAAQPPGESGVATAARFVDRSALAVVRIDIDGANTDAMVNDIIRSMTEVVRETDPDSLGAPDAWGKSVRSSMTTWRERFKEAGGRELYVIVVFNPAVEQPLIGVVPIGEDAKAAELIDVLKQLPPAVGAGGRVMEGAIVTGDERLTKGMPLAAPGRVEEIRRAFQRAGEGAVQIALIPTEETRGAWAEHFREMPGELGGGPATILSSGVRFGWGSISLPPSWTFKLVAESESEEAAAQLAVALRKGIASIAERVEHSQPQLAEAMRGSFEPRAEGNLVVVAAGREKFERLKRAVAPALIRARQMAPRAIAASRMRNQVMGCLIYASQMENRWPKDLETLVKSGHIPAEVLLDPSRPEDVPAYIYVRPDEASMAKSDLSKHAVLYENFAAWPKGGVNVAYADGHVELVGDEAAFREIVEYAKKHAAR